MRYALTKVVTGQQEQIVRTYGDELWEWVCDTFRTSFKVQDCLQAPTFAHLSVRTRTDAVRAVLANVEAEYAGHPDECPFVKRGHGYYWRAV